MGILLDTIPDWELSLRVAFTFFALCRVAAAALVQQGVTAAKPIMLEGAAQRFWGNTDMRLRSLVAAQTHIVSDGAKGYIANDIKREL